LEPSEKEQAMSDEVELDFQKLTARRNGPVWKGPEEDGVTFFLLSRFLTCRERFRLLVVEGLSPVPSFNHRIEFGNMWHVCEEVWALSRSWPSTMKELKRFCQELCRRFRQQQEQVEHWMEVVRHVFPIYINHWKQSPEVAVRKTLMAEEMFNVSYRLLSGRTVRLRGKWDLVDLVDSEVWLQEDKTKGDVRPLQIQRQLRFDFQTMIYLVALRQEQMRLDDSSIKAKLSFRDNKCRHFYPIKGVRYNVVRRPLSGGKGTIIRHKATKNHPEETKEHFYQRMACCVFEAPKEFFFRWDVEVSHDETLKFRRECLDPILEQLCDWWEWINHSSYPFMPNTSSNEDENMRFGLSYGMHWRHPFGVYNVLDEGGSSDLDAYLETGSEVGLDRVTDLFPELG
jgi:hypothetical protein